MTTTTKDGYTIHYEEGELLRSETRYEPAEYADSKLIAVYDGDRELTEAEIVALGWTDTDFPR